MPDGAGGGGSENEVVTGRCWFIDMVDIDCPKLAKEGFDAGVLLVAHGLAAAAPS